MKILALEHELPNINAEAFSLHAAAEARRAWELQQAGILRELYFRADRTDAVLVLECGSPAEAEEVLETLPFVKEGLIAFELIPLRAYSGFERLFASEYQSQ
jgi:muconolactone delta-isomerase